MKYALIGYSHNHSVAPAPGPPLQAPSDPSSGGVFFSGLRSARLAGDRKASGEALRFSDRCLTVCNTVRFPHCEAAFGDHTQFR